MIMCAGAVHVQRFVYYDCMVQHFVQESLFLQVLFMCNTFVQVY
jgi:hypothetical protein